VADSLIGGFSLQPPQSGDVFAAERDLTVTTVAVAANVVTITTSTPHGLVVGQPIAVAGVTAGATGVNSATPSTDTVASVVSATQFTYNHTATTFTSAASGGTVKANLAPSLTQLRAVMEQVDTFNTAGSTAVTIPTWAKTVDCHVIAGGCGGGSGRRGAAASVRCGGGGGAGGGYSFATLSVADLLAVASTVNVTSGAGGAGGAGQTVDSTNGTAGTVGGTSYVGPSPATAYVRATPGVQGSGGTATTGVGGAAGTGTFNTASGASASTTGGVGGSGGATAAPSGGGGGGGITSADAASAGGSAGGIDTRALVTAPAGGAAGANGSTGAGIFSTSPLPGFGGGGGGGSTTAPGTGGAGERGGGGGGGGASLNGVTSGAGGAGGAGIITLIWRG